MLAAVGKIESDHGRSTLPGVHAGQNAKGARGPMQFLPATFAAHARPVPPGGTDPPSPYDPVDAIHAAARYLCATGARDSTDLPAALYAYNHSHTYVADVLAQAAAYTGTDTDTGTATGTDGPGGDAAGAPTTAARTAVDYARTQLGLPYVWGGDGPAAGDAGFDCSGLTHAAYAAAGITLPRTAATQYHAGPLLPPGEPLRPGDLLFFGQPGGRIHHVAISLGGTRMIHAPTSGNLSRSPRTTGPSVTTPVPAVPQPIGDVFFGHRGLVNFDSPVLDATRDRLLARFGTRVEPWWQALPTTIDQLAHRWELAVGDTVGRGNTSLVVRCQRADGTAAILKLTPDADLAAAEAAALLNWQPSGRVPAVWDHDQARGALLLEALPNETPLSELGTPVELNDIAGLIVELHRHGAPVIGNGVVPQAERIDFLFQHWIGRHPSRGPAVTRAVPVERLRRGHTLARELLAEPAEPVLLHGDLHPGNVLDGGTERGLVAIDPRPCIGDAAIDAVDWVFWPTNDPRAWKPRSRALALAVGVSHERLWAWCTAFAALLASSEAAHGGSVEKVDALLNIAP